MFYTNLLEIFLILINTFIAYHATIYIKNKYSNLILLTLINDFKYQIGYIIHKIFTLSLFYLLLWILLLINAQSLILIIKTYPSIILTSSSIIFIISIFNIILGFTKNKSVILLCYLTLIIGIIKLIDLNGSIVDFLYTLKINLIFIKLSIVDLLSFIFYFITIYVCLSYWNDGVVYYIKHSNVSKDDKGVYIRVLKYIGLFIALLILLNLFGIRMETIAITTTAFSVGIGFGLQKFAANCISGLTIIFEKKIKLGDYVILSSGESGIVTEIDLRCTLLETLYGEKIIIPNERMLELIKNLTLFSNKSALHFDFVVNFDVDLENVMKLTNDVLFANSFVLHILEDINIEKKYKYNPSTKVDSIITGMGYCIKVKFWVNDVISLEKNIWSVKSDLIIALQKKFKDNNINFALPKLENYQK